MAGQDRYRIQVQGWIAERWADWLGGMKLTRKGTVEDAPVTIISGTVIDQAALRSLLCKLWDLNLTVISVSRVEVSSERDGGLCNV